jgi:hypothetical protein
VWRICAPHLLGLQLLHLHHIRIDSRSKTATQLRDWLGEGLRWEGNPGLPLGLRGIAGPIHNVNARAIHTHDFAQLPCRRRKKPMFPLERE